MPTAFGTASKMTLNDFCHALTLSIASLRAFARSTGTVGAGAGAGGGGGETSVLYFGPTIEKNQCRRMA